MRRRGTRPEDLGWSWEEQPRIGLQVPLYQTPPPPEEIQEEEKDTETVVFLEI